MPEPLSRSSITVHHIEGRPLVVDISNGQWYEIDQLAAWLLERCDGETTVKELYRAAKAELNAESSLESVWAAIGELHRAGFLVRRLVPPMTVQPVAPMVRPLGAMQG